MIKKIVQLSITKALQKKLDSVRSRFPITSDAKIVELLMDYGYESLCKQNLIDNLTPEERQKRVAEELKQIDQIITKMWKGHPPRKPLSQKEIDEYSYDHAVHQQIL